MKIHIVIYSVSQAGNSSLVKNQCKGILEAKLKQCSLLDQSEMGVGFGRRREGKELSPPDFLHKSSKCSISGESIVHFKEEKKPLYFLFYWV